AVRRLGGHAGAHQCASLCVGLAEHDRRRGARVGHRGADVRTLSRAQSGAVGSDRRDSPGMTLAGNRAEHKMSESSHFAGDVPMRALPRVFGLLVLIALPSSPVPAQEQIPRELALALIPYGGTDGGEIIVGQIPPD